MPESFLWGTATSAHQVEGDNTASDWWTWEHAGNIDRGEVSGRACDHRARFREDLQSVAALGMNSYRFSVEWARLEPREGQWDPAALEFYENIVAECERLGLMPMVTLHHFTLPQWVADRGGLLWKEYPDRFARFVSQVLTKLGARVPLWCTLNEPINLAIGSYLGGYMPPAVRSPRKTALAIANQIRAHQNAYTLCHRAGETRRIGPWKDQPLRVGIAHNMLDVQPYHDGNRVEAAVAAQIDRFYNWSLLDTLCGKASRFRIPLLFSEVPGLRELSNQSKIDFIGVNYYTRLYVGFGTIPEGESLGKFCLRVGFRREGQPASDLGWEFAPSGFGRILQKLGSYHKPIYVTENGLADADDRHRKDFVRSHLQEVARAIAAGVDIRGYYYWSILDNFEWIKGYTPRFGLYEVDYATQERRQRASAEWLGGVIRAHRERGGFFPDLALL